MGSHVIKYHRKDEKIVVTGPRPRPPVREISIEEQQHTQDTLNVETVAHSRPFFRQEVLRDFGKDRSDLVLVVSVEQLSLGTHYFNYNNTR
jgi:hypothetical protein